MVMYLESNQNDTHLESGVKEPLSSRLALSIYHVWGQPELSETRFQKQEVALEKWLNNLEIPGQLLIHPTNTYCATVLCQAHYLILSLFS